MKQNDFDYDKMYSNAPGMHFINLHDAPEGEEEDDDECCDSCDNEDCEDEGCDGNCDHCQHCDEGDDEGDDEDDDNHELVPGSGALSLIRAIEAKSRALRGENEPDENDEPSLAEITAKNAAFAFRVSCMIAIGQAAYDNNAPIIAANPERGTIGFIGLDEDGKVTSDSVNAIAFGKCDSHHKPIGFVALDCDGIRTSIADDKVATEYLHELLNQIDAFEYELYRGLTAWVNKGCPMA